MLKLFNIVRFPCLYVSLVALFLPLSADGHPVAFTGSTSIMSEVDGKGQDFQVFYSFRHWIAAGATYSRLVLPPEEFTSEETEVFSLTPQVNVLAKRWNRLNSQTNFYLMAGMGQYQNSHTNDEKSITRYGAQFDSETRRLYTLVKAEYLDLQDATNIESFVWRGGIAPYLGGFEELNIWFILQAKYTEVLDKRPVLTPLLRFYYKNILWELGSSLRGDSYFSFMVHM